MLWKTLVQTIPLFIAAYLVQIGGRASPDRAVRKGALSPSMSCHELGSNQHARAHPLWGCNFGPDGPFSR